MKGYKMFVSLIAAVTLVAMLATLSGASMAAPKRTLSVMMGLGEEEWRVMRQYVFPKFEEMYGCEIKAYQVEAQDTVRKLEAMHKAGKMEIDIITQDNMQLAVLVDKGLVEDLSAYRSMIPKTVIPALIPVGEFDGKLYFMPYRPNVEIVYYNEAKFKQYGLNPPRTWDELLKVAKFLKEKEGIGRVAIKATLDANTTCHLFDFIKQAGGDPLVLNDAGCVKAFTFLQELWPYLSPDSKLANWNTMNSYIATESVYLGANWPFGVNVIVKDGGKKEIKCYSGWTGPVRESHVLGGEVIGIPVGSPNKDLAIKFMEYLMSKEVQEILVAKMAWPSCRSDAYGQVEEWQKPYFAAVNEALKHAEPRPNIVYWADFEKILLNAFREIVMEGKAVKPTLDKYAAQLAAIKK